MGREHKFCFFHSFIIKNSYRYKWHVIAIMLFWLAISKNTWFYDSAIIEMYYSQNDILPITYIYICSGWNTSNRSFVWFCTVHLCECESKADCIELFRIKTRPLRCISCVRFVSYKYAVIKISKYQSVIQWKQSLIVKKLFDFIAFGRVITNVHDMWVHLIFLFMIIHTLIIIHPY